MKVNLYNQVAVFSSGSQLEWREVEGGELPSPRRGMRATTVGEIINVSGGDDGNNYLTSILSWDPVIESWKTAGNFALARASHAAVTIPASAVGAC